MKTFVILYMMYSQYTAPEKVGWFETVAQCEAAREFAYNHQYYSNTGDRWFAYSCVEYLDNMDGSYK